MEKIIISVEKLTRMVSLTKTTIGNDLENLQEELVFKFTDEFVSGSARLEYKVNGNKYHIPMTRDGESYTVPIKNVVTKEGKIEMQLVIVEQEQDEEIPVFKSNVFYVYCNKSINAQTEAPDDYEYWLDVMQTKLAEMDEALTEVDNLDIDASKSDSTTTVSITKKDGTIKNVNILDGEQGEPGPSNVLSIGTVTKGEEAEATITGTSPSQVLNLVLPKGDKGDKGDAGSDKNYIHRQDVASSEWNIVHNLNKYPSVSIVDSSGNEVFGNVQYISTNDLKIKFNGAFTGKAYLN